MVCPCCSHNTCIPRQHDELRKLYGYVLGGGEPAEGDSRAQYSLRRAVSQVAVTGRVPAVLGRDASLSSSPSSNPPKRRFAQAVHPLASGQVLTAVRVPHRVWGTPMPYVSKFSGRSLSSVLPDAIKQVRRIPKQAQHKRNRLRQQSPVGAALTNVGWPASDKGLPSLEACRHFGRLSRISTPTTPGTECYKTGCRAQ